MDVKRIRKLLKEVEKELVNTHDNGKLKYSEPQSLTTYITVHMGEDLFKKVQRIAIEEDKAMAVVCRELMMKGLKENETIN